MFASSIWTIALCQVAAVHATLVTYPAPADSFSTGPFSVKVSQDQDFQESFVYISHAPSDAPSAQQGKTASWSTFSFDGTATISVTPDRSWSKVVLRPPSLGLRASKSGSAAVFTVDKPTKVVVEFDGDVENSLVIFADPLEDSYSARYGDLYYGPGTHDVGQNMAVKAGTRVYIAGGAWVLGSFTTFSGGSSTADGLTIEGRGILSGQNIAHPSAADDSKAMLMLCGDDIMVRGITLVNAPTYLVNINPYWKGCSGRRTTVENTKVMGWHYTTDGIMVGRDSVVRNNFVRANDDSLKLYMSNTLWEGNLIWQEDNGMPFMLSWNTPTDESNITIRDSTVVYVEHNSDFGDDARPSVFGAVHGASGRISGYHFENIVVDCDVYRPFGLSQQKNPWGGSGDGTVSGVTFKNIKFTGQAKSHSKINAAKTGGVKNIAFLDLQFPSAGVCTSAAQCNFDVDTTHTSGITFSSSSPTPSPTPSPAPSPVPSGGYTFAYHADSSKCLDASEAWLKLADCNAAQAWIVDSTNARIRSASDSTKCLDIPGGQVSQGNQLWMWECGSSNSNQDWHYDASEGKIYHLHGSNYWCVDLEGGDPSGGTVWMWDCNGFPNQQWDYSGPTAGRNGSYGTMIA